MLIILVDCLIGKFIVLISDRFIFFKVLFFFVVGRDISRLVLFRVVELFLFFKIFVKMLVMIVVVLRSCLSVESIRFFFIVIGVRVKFRRFIVVEIVFEELVIRGGFGEYFVGCVNLVCNGV